MREALSEMWLDLPEAMFVAFVVGMFVSMIVVWTGILVGI